MTTKAVVDIAGLRTLATKRRMILFKKLVTNLWPMSILDGRKTRNGGRYSVTVREMLGLNKHQANLLQKRLMVSTLCQLYAVYDQDREKVQQTFGVLAASTQHHALQQFDMIRTAMSKDNAFKQKLLRISWWPCASTSQATPARLRDQNRSRGEIINGSDFHSDTTLQQRQQTQNKTPQKSALKVGNKQEFSEINPPIKVPSPPIKVLKTLSSPVKLPLVKDHHSDGTSKRAGGLVATLRNAASKQKHETQNQQCLSSTQKDGNLSAGSNRELKCDEHQTPNAKRPAPFRFSFPKSEPRIGNKDVLSRTMPVTSTRSKKQQKRLATDSPSPPHSHSKADKTHVDRWLQSHGKSYLKGRIGSASEPRDPLAQILPSTIVAAKMDVQHKHSLKRIKSADNPKKKNKQAKATANKNAEKKSVENKKSDPKNTTPDKTSISNKVDANSVADSEHSPPQPPAVPHTVVLTPKYTAKYARLCKERHVAVVKAATEVHVA